MVLVLKRLSDGLTDLGELLDCPTVLERFSDRLTLVGQLFDCPKCLENLSDGLRVVGWSDTRSAKVPGQNLAGPVCGDDPGVVHG